MVRAIQDSFAKLDPRKLSRNPVILATEIVALLATISTIDDFRTGASPWWAFQIALWLWFTVVFANFAESIAEGRGKAAADALRAQRVDVQAKLIVDEKTGQIVPTPAYKLTTGQVVLVEAGDMIPSDGEIIEGVASVNEAAITGESAPVIRESGGDRSAVTGGTTVASDWIKVRITAEPGNTFIDRMIAMVEGAERRKTPNEMALTVLLAGLTIIFLIVTATLLGLGKYSGVNLDPLVLGALFICLIPTTIGALLSAIGIAGMDRLLKFNVLATSGRAVEASGDVDTLLLDKTGTITHGNRLATEVIAAPSVRRVVALRAAMMASLADETPEGRSIVDLALEKGLAGEPPKDSNPVPFSATTRLSGLDAGADSWRKGAVDAILQTIGMAPAAVPAELERGHRPHRAGRRHASGGRPKRRAGRRHSPQGRGQGRGQGALRGPAPHGSSHRDDHRRQSDHRRRYRLRSRRRRLPRRGHPRGQAEVHPRRTRARAPGGHVRRRLQRRSGARSGRCGRRHADRHPGCAASWEHGRPRSLIPPRSSRSSKSASRC